MTAGRGYDELPFDSAEKLFAFLSPTFSRWLGPQPEPILFRGHWCADWKLIPTALGGRKWLTDGNEWHKAPLATTETQILHEFETLKYFWHESDRQGLRLPEDGQVVRNAFYRMQAILDDGKLQYQRNFWPPTEMLSLLGLAQHSGIGTRLLDWSWDPYVAAYFAASGAFSAKRPVLGGSLAIWTLMLAGIEVQEYIHGKEPEEWPVRLITAPTADNANLRAQKGAFTLHNTVRFSPTRPPEAHPLDEVLVSAMRSDEHAPAVLTKLVLPWEESPKLLSLLSQRGYHAGSLFPGFEGVATLMDERRKLSELLSA